MLNHDINLFLGVFSYPLSGVDYLNCDMLDKYYKKCGSRSEKNAIRSGAIEYIRNKYHISSYDEVHLYLDKWYLYPKYDEDGKPIQTDSFEAIWSNLKCLAKSFISQRDGRIVYKYWENIDDEKFLGGFAKKNKIYLFHSLNRLIPLDILIAIYMSENRKPMEELEGYYGNISVSDALLDRVLEKGVAENHLHGGVASTFLNNWDEFMHPLTEKIIVKLKNSKDNKTSNAINHPQNIFLLFIANILRTFLFISVISSASKDGYEMEVLKSYLLETFRGDFGKQLQRYIYDDEFAANMEGFFLEKSSEIHSLFQSEIKELQDILREVSGENQISNTTDENIFLYKMVRYIENRGENYNYQRNPDRYHVLKMLFLNYLRIKNYFYQQTVQQATIHGLNFFQIEHYRKSSDFRKYAEKLYDLDDTNDTHIKSKVRFWERAIREQLQDPNLQRLEFRTAVPDTDTELVKLVNAFLYAYLRVLHDSYCKWDGVTGSYNPSREFPKVGLVFHFLKKELDIDEQKKKCTGDTFLYYGELYQHYKKQLEVLLNLRNSSNSFPMDRYILGIDVASLENEVPTWVFSGIYEQARDSRAEPINHLYYKNRESHQSLGFTIHAGEDFRHIISGLRRVHEAVTKLKFHVGDRIGHGIALGLDTDMWCSRNKTVIIPRIEALENYVWAYDLLSNHCDSAALINLDFMEKKIYRLTEEIFGERTNITVNMLIKAYRKLFDDDCFEKSPEEYHEMQKRLKSVFCVDTVDDSLTYDVDLLVYARQSMTCAYKMNEPIHILIEDQEAEIIRTVQNLVKRAVDETGVVVEVNPSSNVAVSEMDTLHENQVFGINHNGYDFDNLQVCINSDDPAVFNTNVANELGYIYFAMLNQNANRESALNWIDKLRETGMMASFIRRTDNDERVLRELEDYIRRL